MWRNSVVKNSIILHDNARSHTAAVTDLLCCWQWEILEHPPYSPDMSSCDYDLFAKVKEPVWGSRYNTRDELIRARGRSIRNINKDGRLDGIRRYPNICKNVINKGSTILKVHKCCASVNKSMTEISNCCHYFLSNHCICLTGICLNSWSHFYVHNPTISSIYWKQYWLIVLNSYFPCEEFYRNWYFI